MWRTSHLSPAWVLAGLRLSQPSLHTLGRQRSDLPGEAWSLWLCQGQLNCGCMAGLRVLGPERSLWPGRVQEGSGWPSRAALTFSLSPRTLRPPSMSQRHSDSSLDEKLLESRFHSELRLDAKGNPASGLPIVRGSLRVRDNAAFQPDVPGPLPPSSKDTEPRTVILSTQSAAALKMGTEQLIPRSLAVSSKTKAPARHQSFGAAVLSKEAARWGPRLVAAPSFSMDDMDMDVGPGRMLTRNLRNQSYRAAMKGLETPGSQVGPVHLSPKLQALAEESSQPARCPAKNKVADDRRGGPDPDITPRSCPLVSTCCVQPPDRLFNEANVLHAVGPSLWACELV